MSSPILSVIIPLYNCAKYIERCLLSVLAQDVDMEIIVVDDGSTDGGDRIVREFMIQKQNIQLFSQENLGPSAARNFGIQQSSGKYIYFMDADDFLKCGSLGQIITLMQEYSAEVARFQTQIIPESTGDSIAIKDNECRPLKISNVYSGIEYIESTHAMAGVTLWRHIFSKKLIDDSFVIFDVALYLEEDYVYLFNLLIHAQKVIVCDGDKPHFWVKRMSSSSNSVNQRALNSYISLFYAYHSLLNLYSDDVSKVVRDFIFVRLALAMQVYLFSLVRAKQQIALKNTLAVLKDLKLYPFKTTRALRAKYNPLKGNKFKWLIFNVEPLLTLMLKIHR